MQRSQLSSHVKLYSTNAMYSCSSQDLPNQHLTTLPLFHKTQCISLHISVWFGYACSHLVTYCYYSLWGWPYWLLVVKSTSMTFHLLIAKCDASAWECMSRMKQYQLTGQKLEVWITRQKQTNIRNYTNLHNRMNHLLIRMWHPSCQSSIQSNPVNWYRSVSVIWKRQLHVTAIHLSVTVRRIEASLPVLSCWYLPNIVVVIVV